MIEALNLSPIGLLLATLLSIVNVSAGICKKKVFDRHELFAASFWVRFFAILVFTAVLGFFAIRGTTPMLHPSAILRSSQLQNLPSLVEQLRHPANPAAARIAASLSRPTRDLLANFQPGRDDRELSNRLRDDLNDLYVQSNKLLYDPEIFAAVPLSAETQRVLANRPNGPLAAYANRLLLQDLFPNNIFSFQTSDLFGIKQFVVSPRVAFFVYAFVLALLTAASQLLANRALQVSPISTCLPFMAFSPLFLVGTSFLVLHEIPTANKVMGVVMIFLGGLLMHRRLFAVSWKAPFQAIVKERGSRYILLATLFVSITAPIEKKMLVLSDWYTVGFCYGFGAMLFFLILGLARRTDFAAVLRHKPLWTVMAGVVDASVVLLQFATVTYLPVVVVICIKRSGVVLIILAGWLIFKDKQIGDKLIAAAAMTAGLVIFYLSFQTMQAMILSGLMVAGLALALHLTRPPRPAPACPKTP